MEIVGNTKFSYIKDDGKYTKIRKSGFKTKGEAKDAANELEYNLNKGLKGDRKNLLLSDYFEDWMQLYKEGTVSPITYRKYEDTLMNIKKYMPAVLISDLDRKHAKKKRAEIAFSCFLALFIVRTQMFSV
ncbi:hypothetical protein EfmAA242_08980 [Enterococcus faecium]|nr:hypothetical protein EfmAA242_08980 [Enterococcus faecium]